MRSAAIRVLDDELSLDHSWVSAVAPPWRIALPTASRTTSMGAAVADGSVLARSIIESRSWNEISHTPLHSAVSSAENATKSGSAEPPVLSRA